MIFVKVSNTCGGYFMYLRKNISFISFFLACIVLSAILSGCNIIGSSSSSSSSNTSTSNNSSLSASSSFGSNSSSSSSSSLSASSSFGSNSSSSSSSSGVNVTNFVFVTLLNAISTNYISSSILLTNTTNYAISNFILTNIYVISNAQTNLVTIYSTTDDSTNSSALSLTNFISYVGEMTTYTGTGSDPRAIAFDGTNMWTANAGTNSVTKITPAGIMATLLALDQVLVL